MIMGVEIIKGEIPKAKAKDVEAKPISARLWPINEYFLSTKTTPSKAAHTETNTPTISAFNTKWDNKTPVASLKFIRFPLL
jgi:hypothetical protein